MTHTDDTRKVLSTVLWTLLFISSFFLTTELVLGYKDIAWILLNVTLSAIFIFQLVLVRRGYTRTVAYGVISTLWIANTLSIVTSGGFQTLDYIAYIVVILLTGLLLNDRIALGVTALSIASGGLMLYWQTVTYTIEDHRHLDPLTLWTTSMLLFGVVYAVQSYANRRLKAQEAQYRLLFEKHPFPMWVFATDTHEFLMVNDAAVRQYGYSREEFLQMTIRDIRPPEDVEQLLNFVSALSPAPEGNPSEWRHRKKDGTVFDVEIIANSIDYNGRPARLVMARDVTERKSLEAQKLYARELEVQLETEQELQELKDNLIASVSHEFRTPLAVIMNSAYLLEYQADKLSQEKRHSVLERLRRNVARMTALLDDFLAVYRGNIRELAFKPAKVDMVALCQQVIETLSLSEARKVEFSASETPLYASVDVRLIEDALTDVLSNALKYSSPESAIQVVLNRDMDYVVVKITDEGIGIPEDDLPHMFKPFRRGANVTDYQGIGMGLALVKQNVELHSGTIAISSEVNHGTQIVISLPQNLSNN